MEPAISLPLQADTNFYLWFYLAGFLIGFLVIAYRCLRKRTNLPFYVTLTATIFLASVVGCKLVTVVEHWVFPHASQPAALFHTQVALGGVILSFLVVLLLQKLFKLSGEFVYSIGLATLAALFVQKPGCLLGGCCMGAEVHGFIGISYNNGIMRHPLQLYEMIFYGISLIVLVNWKVRNNASRYFLALVLFSLIQFGAEFLRAPEYTVAFAQKYMGLKLLQWIYLSFLSLNIFMLLMSEKRREVKSFCSSGNFIVWNVVLLLAIVVCFYLLHPYLYLLEKYAINIAFIPALILAAIQLFNHVTIPRYRWASISMLIVPLTLMSQTIANEGKLQKVHKTVGIGYHGGVFQNRIVHDTNPGSCDGRSYPNEFEQRYDLISIRYAVTKTREKSIFSYGVDASYGKLSEQMIGSNQIDTYTIATVNPYIWVDQKWLGVALGAHIGSNYFALTKSTYQDYVPPKTGLGFSPIYPQAHFRVGPKQFFALEYNFANQFPHPLPAFTHEFAFGSGLSFDNGLYFKYAAIFGSQALNGGGSYISAYIPIENTFVLEPLIGFGTMDNVYKLGLSYRFSHKVTEYTP